MVKPPRPVHVFWALMAALLLLMSLGLVNVGAQGLVVGTPGGGMPPQDEPKPRGPGDLQMFIQNVPELLSGIKSYSEDQTARRVVDDCGLTAAEKLRRVCVSFWVLAMPINEGLANVNVQINTWAKTKAGGVRTVKMDQDVTTDVGIDPPAGWGGKPVSGGLKDLYKSVRKTYIGRQHKLIVVELRKTR